MDPSRSPASTVDEEGVSGPLDFLSDSPIIYTISITVLIYLLSFGLPPAVIAPLVTLVQAKTIGQSQCLDRASQCGFIGSSDLYGLGIRLGIYLQWICSMIANIFLPSERRYLAATYLVFTFALLVALFMLSFRSACTYIAEVIVILFIFFGGIYNVTLPFLANLAGNEQGRGLFWATVYIAYPVLLFSCWFWVRMAVGSEYHFAPTPCGTSFFLFSRVRPSHLKSASQFMAFLCLWILSTPVFHLLDWLFQKFSLKKVSRLFVFLSFDGFTFTISFFAGYSIGYLIGHSFNPSVETRDKILDGVKRSWVQEIILNETATDP
jgi:hypothetical protein